MKVWETNFFLRNQSLFFKLVLTCSWRNKELPRIQTKLLARAKTQMSSVFIEGANHGPAPLTLSSGYANRLLPPGDTLVLIVNHDHAIEKHDNRTPKTHTLGGEHAGIRYNEDGSLTVLRGGFYRIFRSGPHQPATRCPICASPSALMAAQNTTSARFSRHLAPPTSTAANSSRSALRTAQLLCGFVGLVLLVIAFHSETSVEGFKNTAKDFAINFASDILAVASILVAAEFIDKVRGRGGQPAPVRPSDRLHQEHHDASVVAPNCPLATNRVATNGGKVENGSETQLSPPLYQRFQHAGIDVTKRDPNPSIYVHNGASCNRNDNSYNYSMHFGGYCGAKNQQQEEGDRLLSPRETETATGSTRVKSATEAKSTYECSGMMRFAPSQPHQHDDTRTFYTSPLALASGIE